MTIDVRVCRRAARLAVCGGVAAGVWLLAVAPLPAQEPALPTARSVVDRHVQAIGGFEAFKAIKSMRLKGTFELTAQSVSGTFTAMSARPNRMRITLKMTGVGRPGETVTAESAYDGRNGWEVDPVSGPTLLSGRRLSDMADEALFDSPLHDATRVKEMTTVSQEDFNRRPSYKIKVVLVSGTVQHEYFDIGTGLQVGSEASRETALGLLPHTAVLSDYRKFGPLLQATTMKNRTMGLEQVFKVTSVEYDVVPDDAFEPPPAIKALIK